MQENPSTEPTPPPLEPHRPALPPADVQKATQAAESPTTAEAASLPQAGEPATAAQPGFEAAALPEATLAQTQAQLAERFPALFTPSAPRPIKLRIQADIQERAPGVFTRKQLSLFLHRHTTSTAYIRALVASSERYDLDGAPAGPIAAEHREAANAELERRRQIVLQRRAAQRGARAAGAAANPRAAGGPPSGGAPGEKRLPGGGGADGPTHPEPPRQPGPGPRRPDSRPGDRRPRTARGGSVGGGRRESDPGDRRPAERNRAAAPPRHRAHVQPPRPDGRSAAVPAAPAEALPDDPARRERALLLRTWETSPLTEANFCALKGLKLADFQQQIALAERERRERGAAPARQMPAAVAKEPRR
jgi:hypothetical protein